MSSKGYRGRPSQATLDNIALPDKIKCGECNKNLIVARFSNNQLKKYQESIYKKGEFAAQRPSCQACMGTGQPEGMYCNDCCLHKSLDDFSKNARKDRDNAICWGCQQRVTDQEPKVEDAIKEDEIEEDYHRKGSLVYSLVGMGSSLPTASKKSSNDTSSEAGTDDSGKVWITEPLSTGGRALAPRGRMHPNAANEQSRRRSGSQDSAATATTTRSAATMTINETHNGYGSGMRSGMAGSTTSQGESKWLRTNAAKKSAEEKAGEKFRRATEAPRHEQLQRDSDSDDSDFEM